MGVNRLNPVQKATYFSKKSQKREKMKYVTLETATDIGFVQYQHSSVQLVLKNG